MIPVVQSISALLCRDQVTVQDVSEALGEVMGGGAQGVPVKVRPADPAVREARVVRAGGSEEVSHVDLTPVQPFPLSDMTAALGAYRTVPRLPNPNTPPSVRFSVRLPGSAHSAAIYASYEDEEDQVGGERMVIGVLIRRD
jgi:hypothetical protein